MGRIRERERQRECVCLPAYEWESLKKSMSVCVPQGPMSVDSERAWHSACQTVYVCVPGGQVCGSAHPLVPVRNLPFSLLKAGETMERD